MTEVIHGLSREELVKRVYETNTTGDIGMRKDQIGCGFQLNPNGSDLRCGDRIYNIRSFQHEGEVQLCPMCSLRKQNMSLLEMLNRKRGE